MDVEPATAISDFSGGINRLVQDFLLESNEQEETINITNKSLGGLTLREANIYSAFHNVNDSTAFGNTDTVRSIEKFFKNDGTGYLIFVFNDGSLKYARVDGGVIDTGTDLAGVITDSRVFLDKLFLVSYNDATRSFDGSTWSTTASVTDSPQAKFCEVFQARLYLANCYYGGASYPNRVVYSELPTGSSLTWDNANNYIDIEQDDGDRIMGLKRFGERLLVFKQSSLYRYDGDGYYRVIGSPGTTSNRSIQEVERSLLFLSDDGIYYTDGGQSVLKSRKIQPYIDGISDHGKYNAFSWQSNGHYYLFVGDIVNSTYNIDIEDAVIDFDIYTLEFRIHSFKNAATTYPFWDAVDVSNLETTTTSTSTSTSSTSTSTTTTLPFISYNTVKNYLAGYRGVYEIGNGYAEKYSATETAYFGTIITKRYYPSGPENLNLFEKVLVFLSRPAHAKLYYKVDDGQWIDVSGQINDFASVHTIKMNNVRGRAIQFKIQMNSSMTPPVLERLTIFTNFEGQR